LQITGSFVTVSAAYDDTQVIVTLPPQAVYTYSTSHAVFHDATLNDVIFTANDIITVTLNRLQTLQVQVSTRSYYCFFKVLFVLVLS
jgi:hypothetical protein